MVKSSDIPSEAHFVSFFVSLSSLFVCGVCLDIEGIEIKQDNVSAAYWQHNLQIRHIQVKCII